MWIVARLLRAFYGNGKKPGVLRVLSRQVLHAWLAGVKCVEDNDGVYGLVKEDNSVFTAICESAFDLLRDSLRRKKRVGDDKDLSSTAFAKCLFQLRQENDFNATAELSGAVCFTKPF